MASRGVVNDIADASIDEDVLLQIMENLDVDGDGEVSKDEFRVPWMKLFPKLTTADFEEVWAEIDADGDGNLSLQELARYYGFNLSPHAARRGSLGMTDEQILEALQLSATLAEMQEEKEARKREKEEQKKREQEEADEAKRPKAARKTGSRRNLSGGSGSDGLRRALPSGHDREKKKTSSGIASVKMPAKVTESIDDPDITFIQMCELGDEKAIKEALQNKEQRIRMEDDKGEMPIHKLARQGCLSSLRDLLDRLTKCDAVKIDLNWQDKQGKTPLFYAVEYGHLKVVQLFLDRGSDIMVENNNGWTALHTAVNADRLEVVELILAHSRVVPQKQKLVDAADRSRRTALHIASFKSKEGEMVTLLLKNGADANAQDAAGNTGIKLADKTGRRKTKELLENHMAAALTKATSAIGVLNEIRKLSTLSAPGA